MHKQIASMAVLTFCAAFAAAQQYDAHDALKTSRAATVGMADAPAVVAFFGSRAKTCAAADTYCVGDDVVTTASNRAMIMGVADTEHVFIRLRGAHVNVLKSINDLALTKIGGLDFSRCYPNPVSVRGHMAYVVGVYPDGTFQVEVRKNVLGGLRGKTWSANHVRATEFNS